jgi:hypothetical protein
MEGEGWPPEPRLYPSATIMILDTGLVPTRPQAISNMTTRAKDRRRFCPNCRMARRIRAHSVKVPSCSAANPGRQRYQLGFDSGCVALPAATRIPVRRESQRQMTASRAVPHDAQPHRLLRPATTQAVPLPDLFSRKIDGVAWRNRNLAKPAAEIPRHGRLLTH